MQRDYDKLVGGYVDDVMCQLQERAQSTNSDDTKVAQITLMNSLGLADKPKLWEDITNAVSRDPSIRRIAKKVGGASVPSWQYVNGLK